MVISEPWVWINGNFKVSNFWVKLLLLLENAPKRPSNWKFEPSPRVHTHSDPIINEHTEQVKKLRMDLSWHALNSMLRVKTPYHTEKQGFGYPWLWKKFQTHPPKPSPVSESQAYPLQKYICFSLLTSGLGSFGHISTPSDRPWIEAYCPKF